MFPKRSLDARKIAMLMEHSANIPGILRAGWVLRSPEFMIRQNFEHDAIAVKEIE